MNTSNRPRRPVAEPTTGTLPRAPASAGLGVRPGAGVLGLARPEPAAPQAEASSRGTLIVGEGIQVKGEIQSCTTLVVEGTVEASLEAVELAVSDGGLYAGAAVVDTARIAGTFSGDLTVRGLLTVEAGGRVSGTLRYLELRIEQGGRLSGDVDLLSDEAPRDEARRAAEPRATAKTPGRAAGERLLESAAAR